MLMARHLNVPLTAHSLADAQLAGEAVREKWGVGFAQALAWLRHFRALQPNERFLGGGWVEEMTQ